MKKISTLVLSVLALASSSAYAQDFTVLTTPEDVLANSITGNADAKATFMAVLDNTESTETQKTEAMQAYMQQAEPKLGYAFDMTFLLQYTSINEDNKGKFTQSALASAWKTDIPDVVFGSNDVLKQYSTTASGLFVRIASDILKTDVSYNKFALYQEATLSRGSYQLNSDAFVAGKADAAMLSAGDNNSTTIKGAPLKAYSVKFTVTNTETIKLGFKRNEIAGLTQIAYNNMCLYKLSNIVEIKDDATGPLAAAAGVDVQFNREFSEGLYYPICLPFVVENWREVFEDLRMWANYANGELTFNTIAGANTQARKPYLAKFKENIDADNYLIFNNVTVESKSAGTWIKTVAEGEEAFPVKMVGNWAAGTVPANCYYLDNTANEWKLSDGTAEITSFSAYIDATGLTEHPDKLTFDKGTTTGVDDVIAEGDDSIVTVYNIQGMVIRHDVAREGALEGLPAGIYIMNGKKIVKR